MPMNGKITLVSTAGNGGKGCCKEVQIAVGVSARDIIFAELGHIDPDVHAITVQGKAVKDLTKCKLQDGDFVIITPTNVKGS